MAKRLPRAAWSASAKRMNRSLCVARLFHPIQIGVKLIEKQLTIDALSAIQRRKSAFNLGVYLLR